MKNIFYLLFLPAMLNAQDVEFGQVWGGLQADNAARIAKDATGDVFVAGTYSSPATFPGGNLEGYGFQDVFVVKTNADGGFLWQIGIGGSGTDLVADIEVDANGDLWVAGRFQGSIDLDPNAGTTVVSADPSSGLDGFIAKYSGVDGSLLSFANISAGGVIDIRSIAINDSGEIYLAGQFVQTVDFNFGAGTQNVSSFLNSGDGFLAKYTADLDLIWVNVLASNTPAIDYYSDVKVDMAGGVYVTGLLAGTADIDPGVGQTNITAAIDAVLIRYRESDGGLEWGFALGGNSIDLGVSLMIAENNDVILAGSLNSPSMDVDPGPGSQLLTKLSSAAAPFIVRYSSTASLVSSVILGDGSTTAAAVNRINMGIDNQILVAGTFSGSIDIAPDAGTEVITASAGTDAFLVQYNADWSLDRYIHISGDADQIVNDLIIDGVYVYAGGQISGITSPNHTDTLELNPVSGNFDAAFFKWNLQPSVLTNVNEGQSALRMYPNPASEIVYFSGALAKRVTAYSMRGEKLSLEVNQNEVQVNTLSAGLYTLEIELMDGQIDLKRLIKR